MFEGESKLMNATWQMWSYYQSSKMWVAQAQDQDSEGRVQLGEQNTFV